MDNERLTELLAQCEQGNEIAFERLYELCSSQLYGVLMRILTIEAVAEEALQESFVKIWQKAGTTHWSKTSTIHYVFYEGAIPHAKKP